jgi:type I restriction enzyme R subunit
VNLVFFKLVRSKTKFWQMVGRGTRLCPDLFTPGKHKEFFYIFDYCKNLEFFSQNPETTDGALGASLGKRLFKSRLELIGELDRKLADPDKKGTEKEAALRLEVATLLQGEVAAMNVENFVVRAKRRIVEKYAKPEAWSELKSEALSELGLEVAGLPSELESEDEEAKRFDLLMLNLQLSVLRIEPAFKRLSEQVKTIAGLLEEQGANVPVIREQMPLIQDIQAEEWWQDVTVPMLENVRRRLRALIKLIEKRQQKIIYTDFEDKIGNEVEIDLPDFTSPESFERFRAKTRQFLREHEDNLVIHKLRMNESLTAIDLQELERMLAKSGLAKPEHLAKAKTESNGLGLFVRSLIGLDREAAKKALSAFISEKTLSSNQIDFVNLIVEYLTEHGVMDASLLYESPFTDLNPQGPEGVFNSAQVDELITLLSEVRERAVA